MNQNGSDERDWAPREVLAPEEAEQAAGLGGMAGLLMKHPQELDQHIMEAGPVSDLLEDLHDVLALLRQSGLSARCRPTKALLDVGLHLHLREAQRLEQGHARIGCSKGRSLRHGRSTGGHWHWRQGVERRRLQRTRVGRRRRGLQDALGAGTCRSTGGGRPRRGLQDALGAGT